MLREDGVPSVSSEGGATVVVDENVCSRSCPEWRGHGRMKEVERGQKKLRSMFIL